MKKVDSKRMYSVNNLTQKKSALEKVNSEKANSEKMYTKNLLWVQSHEVAHP